MELSEIDEIACALVRGDQANARSRLKAVVRAALTGDEVRTALAWSGFWGLRPNLVDVDYEDFADWVWRERDTVGRSR